MLLESYAKINLSLDVTGKRDDGYHEVSTVMQKTSLFDVLDISWEENESLDKLEIEITTNRPYIPVDERNLAYKAARLMEGEANKLGKRTGGIVKINIEKHIPVAAGLAGGSGNGAAVIIALNRLWGLGLDTKGLCEAGKVIGSDVPFMILIQNSRYKCALGTGLGDVLTPLPSSFKKSLVLAKPNYGVSTKEVYQGIDDVEIKERPNTEELVRALKDRDNEAILGNMVNVLEEYTLSKYKEVKELKERIRNTQGVEKVLMSGSGPTVFGVYSEKHRAYEACVALRKEGYEAYWADTYFDRRRRHD